MIRPLVVACLLAGAITAQGSEGPFIGLPIHAIVGANTTGPTGTVLATEELYLKRAGFGQALIPGPAFGSERPDFSLDALFPSRPPQFRLDAVSSGLHTIFVDYNVPPLVGEPVLEVTANAWGAFFFSVSKGSSGESGSVIEREANEPGGAGPGGDLFSVVLPGSNLPSSTSLCVEIAEVTRANDSAEMGLLATTQPELGDFDPFFTFYETAGALPSFLPADPCFYFSLPTSVAMSVPTTWFGPAGPSGATILMTQWDPGSRIWTPITEFASYAMLGLPQSAEIDALAVQDYSIGAPVGTCRPALVLLSLQAAPPEQQMMVADIGVGLVPHSLARPYLYVPTDGTMPESTIKILGGDTNTEVDAICEIDPSGVNGIQLAFFPYVVACRDVPSWNSTLTGAAAMLPGETSTTIVASVSGLDQTVGPSLGAFLLVGEGSSWTPSGGAFMPFTTALAWNFVPATGAVGSASVIVPNPTPPNIFYLDLQWFQFDYTGIYQSNVASCQVMPN